MKASNICPADNTGKQEVKKMAGIRLSNELKGYSASEWKADVGYLVKEFEIQKEVDRSKRTTWPDTDIFPAVPRNDHIPWFFRKRHSPR